MFHLDVITPEKVVFSDEVSLVSVPSTEGVLGILPHHANLFALLTHGEVKIKQGDRHTFLSIGGGFVEVSPDKTIVLVSHAKNWEELDEAEIEAAKTRAEEDLKTKPTGEHLIALQGALRQSITDLKILHKRKSHHI